jgi:hypothetical protein
MRTKALMEFCDWIDSTSLSQAIQSHAWVVPTFQTIHILAIAAVMSSILMINLRLLGVAGTDQPLARVSNRFRPVVWWALPLLLATGATLIIGEPARSLANEYFQLKMLLLVTVIILTLLFQRPLSRDALYWDAASGRQGRARVIALLSLVLWCGIVFAGRWIAYK